MDQRPEGTTRARIIDGAILIAIVAIALWVVVSKDDGRLGGLVGQPAPQFKLRTLSGAVTGTPDNKGKVVLLDFWATWCNPCFRQMPIIEQVVSERPDVVVLPINVDDPGATRRRAMERFMDKAGLSADSLVDDGTVQAMYGVETIPTLVLIGPDGTIRYASSGVHSAKVLRGHIDAVTGGAP